MFSTWLDRHLEEIERPKSWLAKKIGVTERTVFYWKERNSTPNLLMVKKIVDVLAPQLGVTPEALWNDVFLMLEEV